MTNPTGLRLWIDDERVPPMSWTNTDFHWAQTSIEAINYCQTTKDWGWTYDEIHFDHDLGYNYEDGSSKLDGGVRDDTTRPVMLWMIENDFWPNVISIHTGNPIGRAWLKGMAERYAPEGVVIKG